MQRVLLALIAAGLLVAAGTARAALSEADRTFAAAAARDGQAAVETGQIAMQKATSPQVKQFAQRLVSDRTRSNDQLQQIATQADLDLPSEPSPVQQAQSQRLSGLYGTEFEEAFLRDQMLDHQQSIAMFQRAARSSHDPALKDFAQKTLPVLRTNLQMAQMLDRQRTTNRNPWRGQD